jgi:hypothetical protein
MKCSTVKENAINKLLQLPVSEVSKVLVFMAGLDAGARLSTQQTMEQNNTQQSTAQQAS